MFKRPTLVHGEERVDHVSKFRFNKHFNKHFLLCTRHYSKESRGSYE